MAMIVVMIIMMKIITMIITNISIMLTMFFFATFVRLKFIFYKIRITHQVIMLSASVSSSVLLFLHRELRKHRCMNYF